MIPKSIILQVLLYCSLVIGSSLIGNNKEETVFFILSPSSAGIVSTAADLGNDHDYFLSRTLKHKELLIIEAMV